MATLDWPAAFALTALVELAVATPLLPREPTWRRRAFVVLLAQWCSHPSVWFLFPSFRLHYPVYVLVGETFAVGVEAIVYRLTLPITWRRSVAVAALANLLSVLLGFVVQPGIARADVIPSPPVPELHDVALATSLGGLDRFPDFSFFVEGERCTCMQQKKLPACAQRCAADGKDYQKPDVVIWGATDAPLGALYAVARADGGSKHLKITAGIRAIPPKLQNWNPAARVEQLYRVAKIDAKGIAIELVSQRYWDRYGLERTQQDLKSAFDAFKNVTGVRRDSTLLPLPVIPAPSAQPSPAPAPSHARALSPGESVLTQAADADAWFGRAFSGLSLASGFGLVFALAWQRRRRVARKP